MELNFTKLNGTARKKNISSNIQEKSNGKVFKILTIVFLILASIFAASFLRSDYNYEYDVLNNSQKFDLIYFVYSFIVFYGIYKVFIILYSETIKQKFKIYLISFYLILKISWIILCVISFVSVLEMDRELLMLIAVIINLLVLFIHILFSFVIRKKASSISYEKENINKKTIQKWLIVSILEISFGFLTVLLICLFNFSVDSNILLFLSLATIISSIVLGIFAEIRKPFKNSNNILKSVALFISSFGVLLSSFAFAGILGPIEEMFSSINLFSKLAAGFIGLFTSAYLIVFIVKYKKIQSNGSMLNLFIFLYIIFAIVIITSALSYVDVYALDNQPGHSRGMKLINVVGIISISLILIINLFSLKDKVTIYLYSRYIAYILVYMIISWFEILYFNHTDFISNDLLKISNDTIMFMILLFGLSIILVEINLNYILSIKDKSSSNKKKKINKPKERGIKNA
ncbi:MAG: hypothetical protein K4H23_05515 [Mollicutes bacterium PWAP]|nr:hypothetical protein [Mollicutes bacterium PWAP]